MASIQPDFLPFVKALHQLFQPAQLNRWARETKFTQKNSKFTGNLLVSLCSFLSPAFGTDTLVAYTTCLERNVQLSISPQALHERFDHTAVALLEKVLHECLKGQLSSDNRPFFIENPTFKRIRIMDSTAFILDPSYQNDFPGSGGMRHTAGVKVHLEYDLLTGKLLQIALGPEKENDKTFSITQAPQVLPGDLILRDLGYYDLKEYQRIRETQAFYVTRIKANTKLSTKNNTPETFENTGKPKKYSQFQVIDLDQLVDDMFPGETREFPEVYCGRAHYLGDRLIVHKLSEEEYKQRQNQLRRLEQKRKPISPRSERIKQLSVYMTNCPTSMISNKQVHELYSLRWQIELLFKTWKSIFGINQVKKMNVNRLKCGIYGKLIAIFILSSTMFEIRQILYDKQKNEISEQKALSVLKLYLIDFQDAFLKHVSALQTLVDRLIRHIGKNCKKSHKSGKSTCLDILLALNCV